MKGSVFACGLLAALVAGPFAARGERSVVNGVTYECEDGVCRIVPGTLSPVAAWLPQPVDDDLPRAARLTEGYQDAATFAAFVEGKAPDDPFAGKGLGLVLLLVLLAGLAMNLTPCVLPMIPVNLMVIGRSAWNGAFYGLGLACAYGALGLAAALGGLAFGTIQSSPWFNVAVAAVFVALAGAFWGLWSLDFSRWRSRVRPKADGASAKTPVRSFGLGVLSGVLAGACVAPLLVSVLLLTAKLYAEGRVVALALPFAVGVGMALPWPFLGAGLSVLPKPGAWMKTVNRVFAVVVLGLAVHYGLLAAQGFARRASVAGPAEAERVELTPETFPAALRAAKRPVLVDCWASWCKNCAAMEATTLRDARVVDALQRGGFTVLRLRAEEMPALTALAPFRDVKGLPAFVIFE